MSSHQIADRYSVSPAAAPPPDASAYADVLLSDFQDHYVNGRDVWTAEDAMREAPRLLLRALGDRPGAHVLDIGTGHGRDAAILSEAGCRVTGIDLVESAEWAGLTARSDGRARFAVCSLTDLDGMAVHDAVLDNGCLHHQHPDGYGGYLTRVRELLNPGGLFTVSVFRSENGRGRLFANGARRLYREFTEEELTELVTAHGFAPVDVRLVPRGTAGLHYLVGTYRAIGSGGSPGMEAGWGTAAGGDSDAGGDTDGGWDTNAAGDTDAAGGAGAATSTGAGPAAGEDSGGDSGAGSGPGAAEDGDR
ncbi:class I SAM-dependent methyltransferase [Streptomyces sp. NPDC096012]|uniref:SAM-dependent methyltransferase n=1 Tax=Streptomyces sp. NPDC096012 TaxID=3155684 RepID=UPI00336AD4D2